MKTTHRLILLAALAASATPAFPQGGPLTPPAGVPAPTMKTLDQVEPRTPISALPFTISQPGSYYLTGNLEFTATSGSAITINASGVTLDLMGFTLSSTAGVTGSAIHVPSNTTRNICVKNGSITGTTTVTVSGSPPVWTTTPGGFNYGIIDFSAGGRYENLSITGCRITALLSDSSGIIDRVHASSNGSYGIYAYYGSVTNSNCVSNGGTGISATYGSVTNSTCYNNGNHGIHAEPGSVANSNCYGNGGISISASYGSVTDSTCSSNGDWGIYAYSGSVTSCTSTSNTGIDLYATSAAVACCRFGSSHLPDSTRTGNNPSP